MFRRLGNERKIEPDPFNHPFNITDHSWLQALEIEAVEMSGASIGKPNFIVNVGLLACICLAVWTFFSTLTTVGSIFDGFLATSYDGRVLRDAELRYVTAKTPTTYSGHSAFPRVDVEVEYFINGVRQVTKNTYGDKNGGVSASRIERDVARLKENTKVDVFLGPKGIASLNLYPDFRDAFFFWFVPAVILVLLWRWVWSQFRRIAYEAHEKERQNREHRS
jgi:hypothetical protein